MRWFQLGGVASAAPLCFIVCGCGSDSKPESHEKVDMDAAVADATTSLDGSLSLDANHDSSVVEPPSDCVLKPGPDTPDDAFEDSNCDGIDGDTQMAIFLSPNGSDSSPGTIGAPVKTAAKALALAVAQSKDVYACNGQYDESVVLTADGASVYGGYDCNNAWKRVPDRAVFAPSSGVPLTIESVATPVVLERLAFRAASTTAPAQSSIAAVIMKSASVRLSHIELNAADAGPGIDASPPEDPMFAQQAKAANAPGTLFAGDCEVYAGTTQLYAGGTGCSTVPAGATGSNRYCNGTAVRGGDGGHGANASQSVTRQLGFAGVPSTAFEAKPAGNDGAAGSNGAPGSDGLPPLLGFGSIQSGRYIADNSGTDGGVGGTGTAGKGGDGASSYIGSGDVIASLSIGGGGGQGGYPGCGGNAGKGGGGGGASIALSIDDTPVDVIGVFVFTGNGGDGGAPSLGIAGQLGGDGGDGGGGTGVNVGGKGGEGGDGGDGGPGGPGGGGPSIGIVYDSTAPTLQDTTFALGLGGLGAVAPTKTAPNGIRQEVYALSPSDGGVEAGL